MNKFTEAQLEQAVIELFQEQNFTYQKGETGWPIFKIHWIPSHKKKASYTKKALHATLRFSHDIR